VVWSGTIVGQRMYSIYELNGGGMLQHVTRLPIGLRLLVSKIGLTISGHEMSLLAPVDVRAKS